MRSLVTNFPSNETYELSETIHGATMTYHQTVCSFTFLFTETKGNIGDVSVYHQCNLTVL